MSNPLLEDAAAEEAFQALHEDLESKKFLDSLMKRNNKYKENKENKENKEKESIERSRRKIIIRLLENDEYDHYYIIRLIETFVQKYNLSSKNSVRIFCVR